MRDAHRQYRLMRALQGRLGVVEREKDATIARAASAERVANALRGATKSPA